MRFNILTLFPEIFEPFLKASLIGDAHTRGLLTTRLYQIRDYATDKHHTVDDSPYGGGPGMVMKVAPIDDALQAVASEVPRENNHIIVLAARGELFTQQKAVQLAQRYQNITFICGRYEGIDQRVADHLADEELSIGSYVLAGGEAAVMVVMEAVGRLLPGVLGNPESLAEESYGHIKDLTAPLPREYPQYTKPEVYRDWSVPSVLLSGNHAEIARWREENKR